MSGQTLSTGELRELASGARRGLGGAVPVPWDVERLAPLLVDRVRRIPDRQAADVPVVARAAGGGGWQGG